VRGWQAYKKPESERGKEKRCGGGEEMRSKRRRVRGRRDNKQHRKEEE